MNTQSCASESENEEPISRLLLAWEESVATGKPLSAATLCADCPELTGELEREIARIGQIDKFMLSAADFNSSATVAAAAQSTPSRPPSSLIEFKLPGFEILEELGRGGMGVVYKAHQRSLKRIVAIKTLAFVGWVQPAFVSRMRREAKALSQLNDAHVVQVYDVIETPGSISLVLEYVDGGNLSTRLKGMSLSPREAAQIAWTLARTMSTVHQQGLCHRDIKPANVLIDKSGQIKIADFGLVKEHGSSGRETVTGDFFGTPSYMAPEQAHGRKGETDARTDVYAIGATLYEMLTGRPPFSGASTVDILNQVLLRDPPTPRFMIPGIPRDLETICLKCLEKEPKNRFNSAAELADELERFLQGLPIQSHPIRIADRIVKLCRRRPAVAGLVGLLIAATIAITALVGSYYQSLKKYNEDLIAAAAKSNVLQHIAEANERRAEENERRAKESLYASDISRAAVAWKQEDIRDLTDVLERHRPGSGEIDRRGFEWWYLHRRANLAKRVLLKTDSSIYTVCYSPDKKWLVATGKGAIVRFIDPETGQLWKQFATGQIEVNGVTFSPDGSELVTSGDDGTFRIWNIETTEQRLKIATPYRKAFESVYTRDGSQLITCGISSSLHIYDVRSGVEVANLEGHADVVENLKLIDDGKTLLSISNDEELVFWNLDDRTAQDASAGLGTNGCVIYDRARHVLVTGNSKGVLRTIDLNQKRIIDSVKRIDGIGQIALHPKGELLAIGDFNGGIRLKRLDAHGHFVDDEFEPWRAHQSKIYSLLWSTDGSRLISSGKDGLVLSWSLAAALRVEPRRFSIDRPAHDWPIEQISSIVTSEPEDGRLMRWNLRAGRLPMASIGRYRGGYATSSDGKFFVAQNRAGSLQLFTVPADLDLPIDSQLVAELHSPEKLNIFCFTSDSQKLVVVGTQGDMMGAGEESHAMILDVPSLSRFDNVPNSHARCLAIAPDGRRMAIAITDNVMLWDIFERRAIWTMPQINILQIAFSPSGELIATASADRAILIRNATDGRIRNQITNLRSNSSKIVFSPDNRTFVSALPDGAITFTHVATGQELLKLDHIGNVNNLEFAENGRYLICNIDHNNDFPPSDAPDEILVLDASDPTTESNGTEPPLPVNDRSTETHPKVHDGR